MLQKGFGFITLVRTNVRWVRPEIDRHMDDYNTISSTCPFDASTHGITVMLMHDFEKTRKYANHKSGAEKGCAETFRRRIYLHIYFNAACQAEDRTLIIHAPKRLLKQKRNLEVGWKIRRCISSCNGSIL
ncbi:MAG: hypothetical protein K2L18_05250 [Acetatifactor sp.]|nr:hypothetical protein [Acetatifactor sp.]